MRIAMLGTRGVPAHYGGFETAIEEIGRRLVERGHEVTVYCRGAEDPAQRTYLGMDLVHLPALRKRSLETLSHTALSVGHALAHPRPDAAVVFNAANAPFVPALRAAQVPVAVHVDGLEWQRAKWGRGGRGYYRWAETRSVRWADALIADSQGIADYYREKFGAQTELLTYGAPIQSAPRTDRMHELGLTADGYHLVVARFEPENHVAEIVAGYRRSAARLPLVVVGSATYGDQYTALVREHAAGDPRVRLVGAVWDQELLDQLYAGCATYLHGHSVGGTNPSLLRAMGAGAAVIAFDVVFNREVVGQDGMFFATPDDVPSALLRAESSPDERAARGERLRTRAAIRYQWGEVADGYEAMLKRLAAGETRQGATNGPRRRPVNP
jgi:glycosyltransferase involved in cell wall biosynthesis